MIQPGDGIAALLAAIDGAKKSVEIAIFRFDIAEIEKALGAAVERGVPVTALIAYTNRGGATKLRKLEMRLLELGVTVARTANDLLRYHNKMMIVDRSILFVLSYNFTRLDIEHSRGFGLSTTNSKLVQEAVKLFEADTNRQTYTAGVKEFLVSPANARAGLVRLIESAEKELLIYDPNIDDPEMLEALRARVKAGVAIKVLGVLKDEIEGAETKPLPGMRLHTRTILCDRRRAFVGSQSLRRAELDLRREVGLVVGEAKIVSALVNTFEEDWAGNAAVPPKARVIRKTVKALVKAMAPLNPVVENAVREAVQAADTSLDPQVVKETVAEAVKEAVKDHVKGLVKQAVGTP